MAGSISGSIRIEGGASLDRMLAELEPRVSKKIQRKALRSGAKIIADAAKNNAPVDTGLLKRSIKVRAAKSRKGRVAVRVVTGEEFFKGEAFYAAFLEFGHHLGSRKIARAAGAKPGGKNDPREFVEPRPFMRPAFDEKKGEAVRVITDQIRKGIFEAVRERVNSL